MPSASTTNCHSKKYAAVGPVVQKVYPLSYGKSLFNQGNHFFGWIEWHILCWVCFLSGSIRADLVLYNWPPKVDLRCNEFHLLTTCGPNRSQKTEVRRVHRSTARLFIRYFFNVHEKKKRAKKNARHSTVEAARWPKRSKRSPLHTPNVTFSAGVQFSRDSIREFNDRKYEKIESCSLWSRPCTLASSCHIAGRMESSWYWPLNGKYGS